jgi:lipid-binding SYLF domain-containing protein
VGNKVPVAVFVPAAWVSAALSFQVSYDQGTTWADYFNSAGVEVSVSAAIMGAAATAARPVTLDPSDFAGVMFLKLRSGVSGAAVDQTASRKVQIYTRKFYPVG